MAPETPESPHDPNLMTPPTTVDAGPPEMYLKPLEESNEGTATYYDSDRELENMIQLNRTALFLLLARLTKKMTVTHTHLFALSDRPVVQEAWCHLQAIDNVLSGYLGGMAEDYTLTVHLHKSSDRQN